MIDHAAIRELLAMFHVVPSSDYEICDLGDGVAVHEVVTERTVFVRDEDDLDELAATLMDIAVTGDALGHMHAWLQIVTGAVVVEEELCEIGWGYRHGAH